MKSSYSRYYFAWGILIFFYAYQYILRVVPGILESELRNELMLTASQFSTLGSYYMYSYGGAQIFLGLMVDRFGVRLIASLSLLLCIIGGVLFSESSNLIFLQLSRVMLGIGSGAALMSALKIVADFFPEKSRGLFMGLSLSIGTLGVCLSGSNGVISFVESMGWRWSVKLFALFGVIVLLLSALFLPTSTKEKEKKSVLKHLPVLFKQKEIILYAILALSYYGSIVVLADLWGTAYLMEKYQISRAQAVASAMSMYVGATFGSALIPFMFLNRKRFQSGLVLLSVIILILFSGVSFLQDLSLTSTTVLLGVLGFFSGSVMLCFTGISYFTTSENSGLIISCVNTFNMMGGAFLQQIIGGLLDHSWNGSYNSVGVRMYEAEQFSEVFGYLTSLFIVGVLVSTVLYFRSHPKAFES